MVKPFEVQFHVDAKILAIIFICWKYKYPLSYFLSFYEMFGAHTLFILKALSCTRRITLNDNAFASLIEESKKLHLQMIKGISTNLKISQLEKKVTRGQLIDEDIPERPAIDYSVFSEEYADFIKTYLLPNVKTIFTDNLVLRLGTKELYQQIGN